MTKINLDLTDTIIKAAEAAKANVEREIRSLADSVARTLLYDGRYPRIGPEGAVHELIRLKIEEYVLSDKFSQKVDTFIEQSVDPAMEEAIMLLMRSKTRKVLFQPTSPIEAERDDEWIIIQDGIPEKVAWDMELGWTLVDDGTYDVFSSEEKNRFKLPMGGMWMKKANVT